MAKSLLTTNSFIIFHPAYEGGDNCAFCGRGGRMRYGLQFDYDSSCILDWHEDRDFEDHGEVPVCATCGDKFDPNVLLDI